MYVNACGELTCGPVFSLERRRRRRDFTAQPAVMALQWREGAKRENETHTQKKEKMEVDEGTWKEDSELSFIS